jgi:hypothetical protein
MSAPEDTGEVRPAVPPAVAAAIVGVMLDVPTLAKDDKNAHQGYKFTSVDGFLTALRPICAKHGLAVLMDELEAEVTGGNLSIRFGFTLVHASGAAYGPLVRSVQVNSKMGAQAYGAAQSYALKQFLRATFQVATGDNDDADRGDHHQLTERRQQRPAAPTIPVVDVCAELRTECLNAAKARLGTDDDGEAIELIKAEMAALGIKSATATAIQYSQLFDAIVAGGAS